MADGVRLELEIDAGLTVFDGHFDDHPILPGIAEVHWAMCFAQGRLPVAGRFAGMSRLKFTRVIQPPTRLTLALQWRARAEGGALAFAYQDAHGGCASGELLFAPSSP